MPCDFCAGPGRPGHRYGSPLCQRGAHALRTGALSWNFANIVDCALVCPECSGRHATHRAFAACLHSHGIAVTWGIPRRDGAPYRGGPGGALLSSRGRRPVLDRAALEARLVGDGRVLRRRAKQRERASSDDGLADELTPAEVAAWLAWANRHVRRR